MARDGGLRQLFAKRIKRAHWAPIESWGTGIGIPDANCCLDGIEFWVEFKKATANKVNISPGQVAWHERRARAGGRTFIAIRRQRDDDELYIYRGLKVRELLDNGLALRTNTMWIGGPANWDWSEIEEILKS